VPLKSTALRIWQDLGHLFLPMPTYKWNWARKQNAHQDDLTPAGFYAILYVAGVLFPPWPPPRRCREPGEVFYWGQKILKETNQKYITTFLNWQIAQFRACR